MTPFFQGLILGAIQGITEWLPISSKTINTLIMMQFFQKAPDEAIRISIWLHTGTLVAALIYFRHDIREIALRLPRYAREMGGRGASRYNALITFLIIATLLAVAIAVPLVLVGFSLSAVPTELVMALIGIFLIVTGLVQKYACRSAGTKTAVTMKDAVLLGAAQGLSVFPGFSRSGLTVSTLLFRGYEGKEAIRVSFLASIPFVLAGEVGLSLIGGISYDLASLGGIASSFVFGILTIGALLKLAGRIRFWTFCLFLGVLSLLPLLLARLA